MNIARNIQREAEIAKALVETIATVIGDDEDARHDAVQGETGLLDVISAAVLRIGELQSFEVALDERVKALSARKRRLGEQADLLRAAIHNAMGAAELHKIELPIATISLRPIAASVSVADEADIPSDYWKPQPPKLDKAALLKALKAGETIPGASLSNGGETISIRVA